MIRLRLPQVPERLRQHTLSLPEGIRPTVEDCLASGTLLLEQAGIETARLDAECLLASVLGCPRWQVILDQKRRLTPKQFGRYLRLLQRREQREPLAYLLGAREFWSLELSVSPGVLIPRPETETLVEAALAACRDLQSGRGSPAPGPSQGVRRPEDQPPPPVGLTIVDLCTGSGAVAIALARELPGARFFATDSSWRAVRVARANAEAHAVADRVVVLRGDLWRALAGHAPIAPVDVVVANPPYIPSGTIERLMPEVQWEPRMALDGGSDGLRVLREIIRTTPPHLWAGGSLLLEIGADQAAAVTRLVEATGQFESPRVLKDLAGRDRVVVVRRRGDGT
ncbi:MAG TPA: peptide chain release factor N(5)-glutamine methyltransferase [Candidatus Methylomirabilis sp.]|nr:peptide chain release factor N(5)-glutamine methyltransferase [Candidatus Methylomirabilis sp.]